MTETERTLTPAWRARADRMRVPVEKWGRDHWSLLALLNHRNTDHHGGISWDALTLSRRNWPMLYATRHPHNQIPGADAADAYGLRLKEQGGEPVTLFGHCEGDALMDLADEGVISIQMPSATSDGSHFAGPDGRPLTSEEIPRPGFVTGLGEWQLMPYARFPFTGRGWRLAHALQEHMAAGGHPYNFTPPEA